MIHIYVAFLKAGTKYLVKVTKGGVYFDSHLEGLLHRGQQECWQKQLWQQEHEWSSWSSVRKQREIKASAHVSTSLFSLKPQLMDWCHYFLKHTSVLPLLGTEAPISRKVNQFWDFLLSFTGRELLSTWRQQPSGLKSKHKEGSALSQHWTWLQSHWKSGISHDHPLSRIYFLLLCKPFHILWVSSTLSQAAVNSILASTTPFLITLTRTQVIYYLF